MPKECPSCGNMVEDGQLFCPMCGTKIINTKPAAKKQPNRELESLLFTVNANAEVALSRSIFWSMNNYKNLFTIETAYMELIQKYPTEAKVYCAYTDYAVKLILKLDTLPITSNYHLNEKQLNLIVNRCKTYLTKAKEFADDSELEQILQSESKLPSQVEAITRDDRLKNRMKKGKKIQKGMIIGLVSFLGLILIALIIAKAAGI